MYSRWATVEELKERLVKINAESEIKQSGIPMMYDEDSAYIQEGPIHTLVIGSTGSGKTQSVLLPEARLAIKANESFLIHDVKGEIYDQLKEQLEKRDYNTIIINLADSTNSDSFNILKLPYTLYKDGKKDSAIDILNNIAYYFLADEKISNSDPFWVNSACSLFIGLALYLFENESEENINLNNIFELSTDFSKVTDYVKSIDKSSPIYINLASIVFAPSETRGSIISVFGQKIKLFITKEHLSKMISENSIDFNSIFDKKTAIFIISDNNYESRRLVPLVLEEIYDLIKLNKNTKKFNIYLDEFGNLMQVKDFDNMINLSRGYNISMTVFIKSFLELINTYGKETAELIKISFGNIIYLLANDIETLEEISKMCGKKKTDDGFIPLISPEELKLLNTFEAVILIPRLNPYKTKFVPDYKIDWKM